MSNEYRVPGYQYPNIVDAFPDASIIHARDPPRARNNHPNSVSNTPRIAIPGGITASNNPAASAPPSLPPRPARNPKVSTDAILRAVMSQAPGGLTASPAAVKTRARSASAAVPPAPTTPTITVQPSNPDSKPPRPVSAVLLNAKSASTTAACTPHRKRSTTPGGDQARLLNPDTGAPILRPGSAPPGSSNTPPTPPKKSRLLTIRISNIPRRWSEEKTRTRLHLHIGKSVTLRSLAVSATSNHSKVATADVEVLEGKIAGMAEANAGPVKVSIGRQGEGEEFVMVDRAFHGLTTLYSSEKPDVDIIAVTGLSGHALGSWMSTEDNTMWLRDFLPKKIPQARILTYGYNTVLVGNRNKSSITDLAQAFLAQLHAARANDKEKRRPIIFLGHSLGGLVIKEAISLASDRKSQYLNIFTSTHALLFFGVPNLGLNHDAVTQMLLMVEDQPNRRLIEDLEVDKDGDPGNLLLELRSKFRKSVEQLFPKIQIRSFFELQQSGTVRFDEETESFRPDGKKVMMVTKQSANSIGPFVGESSKIPLEADHRGLVKFTSESDVSYTTVTGQLLGLISSASSTIITRFNKQKAAIPIFSLPASHGPSRAITTKNRLLSELHSLLSPHPPRHSRLQIRLASPDTGSYRRTRLALDYVHRHSHTHHIFWWEAQHHEGYQGGFLRIAREARIDLGSAHGDEGVRRKVAEWLAGESSGKWVLVIDNCGKRLPTMEWAAILEQGGKGAVLVLGDAKEVGREMSCERFELGDEDARLVYPEGPEG